MSQLKEQDGKYYQQCKVVMLTTEKESRIFMTYNILTLLNNNHLNIDSNPNQHLYILSDEEIKEGDWIIGTSVTGNKIFQTKKVYYIGDFKHIDTIDKYIIPIDNCKKIITTTDSSLGLPQPSQSFIKKYIEEYNSGNIIEDVVVEYEYYPNWHEGINYGGYVLVIKNNTITIKKLKDSYSREELSIFKAQNSTNFLEFIYDRMIHVHGEDKHVDYMLKFKEINNWIKENL